MYLLQNIAVGLSAAAAWIALEEQEHQQQQQRQQQLDWAFWAWVTLLIALGSVSSLGSLGATVAVEKDWVKALCQGSSERLSQVNAGKVPICFLLKSACMKLYQDATWRPVMLAVLKMDL